MKRLLMIAALAWCAVPAWGQCRVWTQAFPGTSPAARAGHAMAFDSRDDPLAGSVMFGGRNGAGTYYPDTWVYDGTNWSQRATVGPSPREYHSMVFDEARGRVVLFGGQFNNTRYGDTWEWDGVAWSQVATVGPSPRQWHAMAYDSRRQRTVLFGGWSAGGYEGDTWEWDGVSWTEVFPATIPAPRTYHAMAFNPDCRAVVITGGQTDFGYATDTWEYDGLDWRPVLGVAPYDPRLVHSMVYDAAGRRLVVIGGFIFPSAAIGTWEYGDFAWRLVSSAGASNRFLGAAVFDSQRGRAVHFGGFINDTSVVSNETWEYAPVGSAVSITTHPINRIVLSNQSATFSVVAAGSGPLTYRWRRNGVPVLNGGGITGATTATLSIAFAQQGHFGAYDCVVSGACGSVVSNPAALKVHCFGDSDNSGVVDNADITAVLANWLFACP